MMAEGEEEELRSLIITSNCDTSQPVRKISEKTSAKVHSEGPGAQLGKLGGSSSGRKVRGQQVS